MAKPAGLGFHAEAGCPGLAALARQASGLEQLYPVHRLDRMTSGLVLFARSPETASGLGDFFAQGLIGKYYLAISARKPRKTQGRIAGSMIKGRSGNWRLVPEGGPFAATRFFSYGIGGGMRLFILKPETGRTHQIRVALKSLGSPILGDERYGGAPADRGYLHAYALRFNWRGKEHCFLLPPGEGRQFFAPACRGKLDEIGLPWELPWPGRA